MPTNLILNSTNYADAALTNGKSYYNGDECACNYPLDNNVVFTLSVTLGSIYVTASAGDFLDLLGCDIQNNNVPVRKWFIGTIFGEILEIDYVISATSAVLKEPSSYSLSSVDFVVIEYWESIAVASTTLSNTDGFGSPSVLANSKIGPLILNLGPNQSTQLGSEPISVNLASSGAACQLTVKYQ